MKSYLTGQLFGKADADSIYNEYMKQKWIYIKELIPIIEKYDNNRNKYKTLNDIMPEVVAYFDNEEKNNR
ncbi:MAG: DUF4932 domain-containing protein [Arachidicoccus sp.]|nr:DUF4932 domain-containing protein [Arachidicoccus sp.]